MYTLKKSAAWSKKITDDVRTRIGSTFLLFDGTGYGTDNQSVDVGSSNITDISDFIIKLILTILEYLGILAVLIVIIAGILFIVSGGNDDLRSRARRMIYYAVIGLLVIIFASVIVRFFVSIFI